MTWFEYNLTKSCRWSAFQDTKSNDNSV